MADRLKGALNAAKTKASAAVAGASTAIENRRNASKNDGAGGMTTQQLAVALKESRRGEKEATERAEALERAQASLNGEMRRMANEMAEIKEAYESAVKEKEEMRTKASSIWTEMTAEIETLKQENERIRATEGADEVAEEALKKAEQKGHIEARALRKVIEEDRAKFAELEKELKDQLKELEDMLAAAKEGALDVGEQRDRTLLLESKVTELESELRAKVEALTLAEKAGAATQELESQLARAREECNQAKEDTHKATASQQEVASALEVAKSELQATTVALEREKSFVSKLKESEAALKDEITGLRAELDAKVAELRTAQTALASGQSSNQEVESARQLLESQLASVQAELRSKSEALDRAQASSSTAVQELESQVAALRSDLEEKSQSLNAAEASGARAQEAESARQLLESQLASVQAELQSKSEALDQACAASVMTSQGLESNLNVAKEEARALESDLETLRAELTTLRGELEHKQEVINSFEQNSNEARQELEAKLQASLQHARESVETVTKASEEAKMSLNNDLEALKANLEASERKNAVMEEELRLTNEALNRTSVEASGIEGVRAQLAEVSNKYRDSEKQCRILDEALQEANERLREMEDRLKDAEASDATAAEALRVANEQAAKAKDSAASIASTSATQFAQERQMMKNALGELQTERDILVKMLKTFHAHSNIHSTSVEPRTDDQAPFDFAKRFTEAPSLAGVFTPRKRTPYVEQPASPQN